MNAGELKEQVDILELVEVSPETWAWKVKERVYAKAEHQTMGNIFSKNGLSARSIKFTIRAYPDLTLHNALAFSTSVGEHCFLTDINPDMRSHYVLTAALVEPVVCTVERTSTSRGKLNRPVVTERQFLTFPACITEKYVRQTQQEPMSVSEIRYVLITPKAIDMHAGELVSVDSLPYEVAIPHTLDAYKNEYEILRRSDN